MVTLTVRANEDTDILYLTRINYRARIQILLQMFWLLKLKVNIFQEEIQSLIMVSVKNNN